MKITKNTALAFGTSAGLLLLSATTAFAQANTPVPFVTGTIGIKPPSAITTGDININQLIAFVINALIVVGIVLSLVFLLYGGIRWIISGGDKAKVDTARSTIVASIVGLIIVILAWVIINSILLIFHAGSLTGGFQIPSLGVQ